MLLLIEPGAKMDRVARLEAQVIALTQQVAELQKGSCQPVTSFPELRVERGFFDNQLHCLAYLTSEEVDWLNSFLKYPEGEKGKEHSFAVASRSEEALQALRRLRALIEKRRLGVKVFTPPADIAILKNPNAR